MTITQDARLIVRAPYWVSAREIDRLIAQKQRWIDQKQAFFRQRPRSTITFTNEEKASLKKKALEHIRQRVEYYAALTGLSYKSVKVNGARTRWGSCGHEGTLNFTWRLIMAPARVIDYVVVHELMHLKQRNHSYKFWDEVKMVIPDYRQDERWLKDNSRHLSIQ